MDTFTMGTKIIVHKSNKNIKGSKKGRDQHLL